MRRVARRSNQYDALRPSRHAPPQFLPLASLQAPHRSSRLIGHVHGALARHAQNEAREIRAPNLLIWSQTRCHCAIAPPIKHVPATAFTTTCHLASSALTILSARAQPTTHPQGCSKTTWTVCPSGLRGWTQVPLARAAWAQIPQLSFHSHMARISKVGGVHVRGVRGGRGLQHRSTLALCTSIGTAARGSLLELPTRGPGARS